MEMTLQELATLVDGQLHGDGSLKISDAATLANAGPADISLADGENFLQACNESAAAAIIVSTDLRPDDKPCIQVDNVQAAFTKVVSHFRKPCVPDAMGISPAAHISPTAQIGPEVDIYPGVTIGDDVEIGRGSRIYSGVHIMAGSKLAENVTLFPNVVLYENTVVGPRVVIHAGAVLGAYGFGYEMVEGRHQLSAQLGFVEIEADVEIGACTTIDRGTYDATVIGAGTKIDNQVMIAHNCRIGRHNIFCSQVGIAGSVTTGDYSVFAGQVGVKDHVNIGHQCMLGAKAGVMADIPDQGVYAGIPATPIRKQIGMIAALIRLPEMRKALKRLEKEVALMKSQEPTAPRQDAA